MLSKKLKGFSPIGLVVLVAIVGVIAVFAYSFLNLVRQKPTAPSEVPAVSGDAQVQDLEKLSDSDEINVIESELNSTNVEALDQGLNEEVNALGL